MCTHANNSSPLSLKTFDPHHVLGLVPGATPGDIRGAFRRLAMRWHPDRNPDPLAAERFRQIREAHDALLELAESGTERSGPAVPVEEGELWVSFEDAIFGAPKPFALWWEASCGECGGEGSVALGFSRLCPACQGSGKIRFEGRLATCDACRGRGYRTREACPACGGEGRLRVEKVLTVVVPPLCREGRILRLAGASGEAGDLLLAVRYAAHPLFGRTGDDLRLDMPISALAWLAGAGVTVPVPGGEAVLPVPPGASSPFVLAGQGLPRGGGVRGDLLICLVPEMPRELPDGIREALLALDRQLGADPARHFPAVAAWRARQAGG
jgi:molecular chaperone DnaJ